MRIKTIRLSILCLLFLHIQTAQAGWLDKLGSLLTEDNTSSAQAQSTTQSLLSNEDIGQAFKQALDIGSQKVVKELGQADAFNGDSQIRIPLPENMKTVKKWLDKVGMGGSLNDL